MLRIDDSRLMRRWAEERRALGARIALVPTMGALHEGHMALVRRAAELADEVVVSIFVNPIQFDDRGDFEAYSVDLKADAALLKGAGVSVLFAPDASKMYASGFQTHVEVGKVTEPLCGAHRPGHFRGVTTVVAKLFNLVRPHLAVFGEKDYQQLVTIKRMVADLDFGIDIVGMPTVRERDGLALSSRNRRLGAEERLAAGCVPRALRAVVDAASVGVRDAEAILDTARVEVERAGLARLEYAELRDPETLEKMDHLDRPARFALAVWVGGVRLIDNCPVTPALMTTGVDKAIGAVPCDAPVAAAAMQVSAAAANPTTTGGHTR